MAYAFTEAGFDAYDVHMTDDRPVAPGCQDFRAWSPAAASSYGDTLGAGIGGSLDHLQPGAVRAVPGLLARPDTFGLGVCNGCQMFAELADIIQAPRPGRASRPTRASASRARLSMVEVLGRPACSWGHGRQPAADRGRARRGLRQLQAPWRRAARAIAAMRYVDNFGQAPSSTRSANGSASGS